MLLGMSGLAYTEAWNSTAQKKKNEAKKEELLMVERNIRGKVVVGYKSVNDELMSGHGSVKWEVGVWKKFRGGLELCKSGFHASEHPYDVLNYLQGNRLFRIEAKGKIIRGSDKFVAEEMRLVREVKNFKRLSVEFAVWNAKRCLKNYEKKYPNDDKPRKAISSAEKWLRARNDAERKKAESAAWSAAESAAKSARSAAKSARSAAWSAA